MLNELQECGRQVQALEKQCWNLQLQAHKKPTKKLKYTSRSSLITENCNFIAFPPPFNLG